MIDLHSIDAFPQLSHSASPAASTEQRGQPPSTPTNTSVPGDHKAKLARTPVKATASSTSYHSGRAVTGSDTATAFRREQYAREMRMKCAELGLEDFLSRFMPTGVNGDIPSSVTEKIPSFDQNVWLGTAEKPICEALVRACSKSMFTFIITNNSIILVRGIPEDTRWV